MLHPGGLVGSNAGNHLINVTCRNARATGSSIARGRAVCFYLLQVSPSFSLRGGTREIIKGIIARGLGLR